MTTLDAIVAIPQQPQRQDSTTDQLRDLQRAANKLGLYDAADVIKTILANSDAKTKSV